MEDKSSQNNMKNTMRAMKLSGAIFLIIGICGIAMGQVDRKAGYFTSLLGWGSGLFAFLTGVGGLLSYIDPGGAVLPYSASCVMLILVNLATIWVEAIAVNKTKKWCEIVRKLNETIIPPSPGPCPEGDEKFPVAIEYTIIALSAVAVFTAILTVIRQAVSTWSSLSSPDEQRNTKDNGTASYISSNPHSQSAYVVSRSNEMNDPDRDNDSYRMASSDVGFSSSITSLPQMDNTVYEPDEIRGYSFAKLEAERRAAINENIEKFKQDGGIH
ncbi:uncharacterized protein [Apostichopus japonicus]|uniref:uncharacterized protein isoform X2 n=1 Tax=Stichopus japonicus TaxID=307972 RepID=UPI003AB44F6C